MLARSRNLPRIEAAALFSGPFARVTIANFFFFLNFASFFLLPLYVKALGGSETRRAIIVPTLLILAGSIATMALVRSIPVLVCAGALFGSAQGISYPTLHAFLVDLTAEAHLGRAQALFNGAFNFGVTSSAFIFGVAAEQLGYRPMFALASLTPLTACVLFYRYGAATRARRSRH